VYAKHPFDVWPASVFRASEPNLSTHGGARPASQAPPSPHHGRHVFLYKSIALSLLLLGLLFLPLDAGAGII